MSVKTRNRRVMTNAARRALRERVNRSRAERGRIVAVVSRGERWWRYVHEQDLTSAQRDEIGEALRETLAHPLSGEVERYGDDVSAMYHAGFYLSVAWMLFGNVETRELNEVFRRHRIWVHHDWWITDGWDAYSEKFGVSCPACGATVYGYAEDVTVELSAAYWPHRCGNCHAEMPERHDTNVWGSGDSWYAECSCKWEAPNAAKAERYARASATRHANAMGQAAARAAA